jgi:E3 ubiquitin-protein ligase HECTD2
MVPELDPKLLLLGDVGENGTWWTGPPPEATLSRNNGSSVATSQTSLGSPHTTSHSHSPHLNWEELAKWYHCVINAAEDWFIVYEELSQEPTFIAPTERDLRNMESDLLYAQEHVQRHLMKATELLLKRPGRPLSHPSEMRFLLVILENPFLYSKVSSFTGLFQNPFNSYSERWEHGGGRGPSPTGTLSGQHSGLIKRVVGLISNSSTECHDAMISWLARSQTSRFTRTKDLVSAFLTYRMLRSNSRKQESKVDITAGLIPQMQIGRSGAYLHDEIGGSRTPKKNSGPNEKKTCYTEDWQIKAAARVLALFFAANNLPHSKRTDDAASLGHVDLPAGHSKDGIHANGQLLPTSDFYISIIDYSADLVGDFEAWENRRGKFAFCQYPFLLSIRAKTEILEHDARRQMQTKARDAFFDSIMSRRAVNQYFSLDVRRDCLVDDSLKAVSEVIGSGSEDIKKALRISFRGEEGIDGGGLRKEWFLMLIREVFNPDHGKFDRFEGRCTHTDIGVGLFIYDDESQFCYFNPNSFETTDQFFLVGVVIGLAIYNSTILDVALPPFAFRKLLASAPAHGMGPSAHPRPAMKYTLEDLADYRPRLARGLRQLLEFDGDVQSTFGLDFAIDVDKYGTTVNVPLCYGGERKAVTNANRREYVDLYVLYLLDTSVKRQFEPFKRGFYTVCGGNAFSLFRPEEIELLVRGSDQPLDIPSLRAVATYDNWGTPKPDESEPVVQWFWNTFERAPPAEQRSLLSFITGSDRIPAIGASTLSIRVSCLGDETERFPIARTCFNSISLFKYETKEKLEAMLWRAVHESEGFGLK